MQDLLRITKSSPVNKTHSETENEFAILNQRESTKTVPTVSITENVFIISAEAVADGKVEDGVYFNPMHNVIVPTTQPLNQDETTSTTDTATERLEDFASTARNRGVLAGLITERDLGRQSKPNVDFLFTSTSPATATPEAGIGSDKLDYEENVFTSTPTAFTITPLSNLIANDNPIYTASTSAESASQTITAPTVLAEPRSNDFELSLQDLIR